MVIALYAEIDYMSITTIPFGSETRDGRTISGETRKGARNYHDISMYTHVVGLYTFAPRSVQVNRVEGENVQDAKIYLQT